MKNKLKEVIKNPASKLIAIDLDGTLCHGEFWEGFDKAVPNKEMIELVWKLYKSGAHIIIYTARQPIHYPMTHGWLVAHGVPFHGIAMTMKPGADCYIDDKALNIDDL